MYSICNGAIITSPINLNILNVSNITQSFIGKTILILYNTVDIFLKLFLLKFSTVGPVA